MRTLFLSGLFARCLQEYSRDNLSGGISSRDSEPLTVSPGGGLLSDARRSYSIGI